MMKIIKYIIVYTIQLFTTNKLPIQDGVWSNPLAPHFIFSPPDILKPVLHETVYSALYPIGLVEGDIVAWFIVGLEQVIANDISL